MDNGLKAHGLGLFDYSVGRSKTTRTICNWQYKRKRVSHFWEISHDKRKKKKGFKNRFWWLLLLGRTKRTEDKNIKGCIIPFNIFVLCSNIRRERTSTIFIRVWTFINFNIMLNLCLILVMFVPFIMLG